MQTSDVIITGGVSPVGRRRFRLGGQCDVSEIHKHPYNHETICFIGQIKVYGLKLINGEMEIEAESGVLSVGQSTVVAKDHYHMVEEVSEEPVMYECFFSHRDFDGIVIERHMGNDHAYDGEPNSPEAQEAIDRFLKKRLIEKGVLDKDGNPIFEKD